MCVGREITLMNSLQATLNYFGLECSFFLYMVMGYVRSKLSIGAQKPATRYIFALAILVLLSSRLSSEALSTDNAGKWDLGTVFVPSRTEI